MHQVPQFGAEILPLVLAILIIALVVVQLAKWAGLIKDGKGARIALWSSVLVLSILGYTFAPMIPLPEQFFSGAMLLVIAQVGATALLAAIGSGGLYNVLEYLLKALLDYLASRQTPG